MTQPTHISGQTPLLVFSHGNGLPGGTYGVLLRRLQARGYQVKALDKFGHDPRFPVSSNWPHLVEQLREFASAAAAEHDGPLYLVGHSMGGLVSLMCAAQHPVLGGRPVRGVVMLDTPTVLGWRAHALGLAKRTPWIDRFTPAQLSRNRRHVWTSAEEAHTHFARRRFFALWEPEALRDYVEHGTHDESHADGTQRVLSFRRDIETQIFNTLPHNLGRLLRQHPLRFPLAFIGGTESEELRRFGLRLPRKVLDKRHPDRFQMLPGTHLYPLERPDDTVAAIERALRSFG